MQLGKSIRSHWLVVGWVLPVGEVQPAEPCSPVDFVGIQSVQKPAVLDRHSRGLPCENRRDVASLDIGASFEVEKTPDLIDNCVRLVPKVVRSVEQHLIAGEQTVYLLDLQRVVTAFHIREDSVRGAGCLGDPQSSALTNGI